MAITSAPKGQYSLEYLPYLHICISTVLSPCSVELGEIVAESKINYLDIFNFFGVFVHNNLISY